jgi:hypothetical protein
VGAAAAVGSPRAGGAPAGAGPDAARPTTTGNPHTAAIARALGPLELPDSRGRRTTVKHIPPSSLAQALLEVLTDVGKSSLASGLEGLAAADEATRVAAARLVAAAVAGPGRPAGHALALLEPWVAALGNPSRSDDDRDAAATTLATALQELPGAQPHQTLLPALAALGRQPGSSEVRAGVVSALARVFPDSLARQRVEEAFKELADTPVGPTLKRLWDTAGGQLDAFRTRLESWLEGELDRLGGLYRRSIRGVLAILAVLVGLTLNINAFALFRDLQRNPEGLAQLVALSDTASDQSGTGASSAVVELNRACTEQVRGADPPPHPEPPHPWTARRPRWWPSGTASPTP